MTFQNERAEIIAIAEMLTDGENIYCLLGAARAMLQYEAETHEQEGGTNHDRKSTQSI